MKEVIRIMKLTKSLEIAASEKHLGILYENIWRRPEVIEMSVKELPRVIKPAKALKSTEDLKVGSWVVLDGYLELHTDIFR